MDTECGGTHHRHTIRPQKASLGLCALSSQAGTKGARRAFSNQEEMHMDRRPKMRNEFGLDKDNALDVQKEAAKGMVPWVLGAVALLAVVGLLMFGLPLTTATKSADV